jgi:hypothetical protein
VQSPFAPDRLTVRARPRVSVSRFRIC